MIAPNTVPSDKQQDLQSALEALASVEGVAAIVLGGSYARGTFHANFDLDLATTVSVLEALWQEVVSLAGNFYKPKYTLHWMAAHSQK